MWVRVCGRGAQRAPRRISGLSSTESCAPHGLTTSDAPRRHRLRRKGHSRIRGTPLSNAARALLQSQPFVRVTTPCPVSPSALLGRERAVTKSATWPTHHQRYARSGHRTAVTKSATWPTAPALTDSPSGPSRNCHKVGHLADRVVEQPAAERTGRAAIDRLIGSPTAANRPGPESCTPRC